MSVPAEDPSRPLLTGRSYPPRRPAPSTKPGPRGAPSPGCQRRAKGAGQGIIIRRAHPWTQRLRRADRHLAGAGHGPVVLGVGGPARAAAGGGAFAGDGVPVHERRANGVRRRHARERRPGPRGSGRSPAPDRRSRALRRPGERLHPAGRAGLMDGRQPAFSHRRDDGGGLPGGHQARGQLGARRHGPAGRPAGRRAHAGVGQPASLSRPRRLR